MAFVSSSDKLRKIALARYQNREFTQSELGRYMHVSQAALSQFLYGKRGLTNEHKDALMKFLNIPDQAISSQPARARDRDQDFIPVVRHEAAAANPIFQRKDVKRWSDLRRSAFKGMEASPAADRRFWERFSAIEVSRAQVEFMQPIIHPGSVLFVDRHKQEIAAGFSEMRPIYAIFDKGRLLIGYVEIHRPLLIIRPERSTLNAETITLLPNEDPGRYVVGQICCMISMRS